MRIFIDINHPAHVHFFKNFIWYMKKKGHEFLISSRDKEVALRLLDAYNLEYYNRGKGYTGLFGKTAGMLKIDWNLYHKAKQFKPDILLGLHNTYTAHLSRLLHKPSITFTDTEHAKLANLMTFPFTDVICTPSCFMKELGKKQVRYDGYHELAYLHPNRFKPNPAVLDELDLDEDETFFVLRFVSWGASHDVGQKGLGQHTAKALIETLEEYGHVFVVSESRQGEGKKYRLTVPPEKIHDVLYHATICIGEGATMASEAAVLGTPAVYINTLRLGYLEEQESRYQLTYNFSDARLAVEKTLELLKQKNLKRQWQKKRERLLKDKIDVTAWMTKFIEKYGVS